MKIVLTGSITFEKPTIIKDFLFKLKQRNEPNITIITGARENGAEKYIRKYSIEFGFDYKEFNPAYTVRTLYSGMPTYYYNQKRMIYHDAQRDQIMITSADIIIIFIDMQTTLHKDIVNIINMVKKNKKPLYIIKC